MVLGRYFQWETARQRTEMQSERPRVLSYIQRPVSTIATPLH